MEKIGIQDLLSRLYKLFIPDLSNSNHSMELLKEFRGFVGSRNYAIFDKYLESINPENKT